MTSPEEEDFCQTPIQWLGLSQMHLQVGNMFLPYHYEDAVHKSRYRFMKPMWVTV
jgi:hypothetical protein